MAERKSIPYGLHELDQADVEAVLEVLRSGSITQGQKVEEFGQALADYVGAKHGVAVSSGSAALHLSVSALDIGPGDEVITTPMTFCATANAVLYQGGDVRFVDIDKNTLNIDPNRIEDAITSSTKAIIPVDFRGHPGPLPEIWQISKQYGLKVIEDGSHSIGSSYTWKGKNYTCGGGKHTDLCTFSFHPVKHITTGEGGAILTNNTDLFKCLSLQKKHGIDRNEQLFSESKRVGSWKYDMYSLGFNYRLTDFQAALGISQLKKIEKFRKRRREIVTYYNENFSDISDLILPYEKEDVDSNFHIYVLQVNATSKFDRYDLFEFLRNKNYAPMVHYCPLHFLSYYRNRYDFKTGDFPIAEQYYKRAISIPLYPSLSDAEVEGVVNDIRLFFLNKKK